VLIAILRIDHNYCRNPKCELHILPGTCRWLLAAVHSRSDVALRNRRTVPCHRELFATCVHDLAFRP